MADPASPNPHNNHLLTTLDNSMTRIQNLMNVLLIFLLLLACVLSQILPLSAGYENSLLEWIETLFLLVGFGAALIFSWCKPKTSFSPLWSAAMPFWIAFCGRELSWGAAFFPPVRMGPHGPVLLHLRQLPYSGLVYPILAVFLGISFYIFFKAHLAREMLHLFRQKRFPFFPLSIVFLTAIVASCSEHHLFVLQGDRNQLLEELMEFVCYIGLFVIQLQLYIRTKLKS